MARFYSSTIGRKFMMAMTGFFLMIFLIVHLVVNLTLFAGHIDCDGNVLPKEEILFNQGSHFMATNPIIQVVQYVLAFGIIYHIILGIIVTIKNNKARGANSYEVKNKVPVSAGAKTMIYSGVIVLLFLILHIYDYLWKIKSGIAEELKVHQDLGDYGLVVDLFKDPIHSIIYIVSFLALGLHLSHGAKSAFQSSGVNHRIYTPWIKNIAIAYFVIIALGFISIAFYFSLVRII